jgi:hypothetical protein
VRQARPALIHGWLPSTTGLASTGPDRAYSIAWCRSSLSTLTTYAVEKLL